MKNISIKTDYSLSESLIKINDLIKFAKENNYNTLGIVDNNLSYFYEFYTKSIKHNIKPIIGLNLKLNDNDIYLYPKDEKSLKELFKLNTYLLDKELDLIVLNKYTTNTFILLPYESINIYDDINKFTNDIYIGVLDEDEFSNAKLITSNVVYFNIALSLTKEDTKYINLLNDKRSSEENTYLNNYIKSNEYPFTDEINITITKEDINIPKIKDGIEDFEYLKALTLKGLNKRLDNNITKEYQDRLIHELDVIKSLGFERYFLIVYDFVLYAHQNNILVGPGRGSAAGSLVSYAIGITNVDPVKYNLLFERFLNIDRVTMPDIDIDFDSERRDEIITYLKNKYGELNVLSILTYSTQRPKQALLTIARIYDVDIKELNNNINSSITLKENLNNKVKSLLNNNSTYKKIYYEAMKIEGLKKNISTHAAGVIISNEEADNYIPIVKSGDNYLTGLTMHYLEELNLLKMDILGLSNLTMIKNVIKDDIDLNDIPLDDKETLLMFERGETKGIFQFERTGMINFIKRLKPKSFNDLVSAIALYRPGPMENIPLFIKNKNSKNIKYLNEDLEVILKETYGVIVYQEQVMEILKKVANYSYKEADNIRRAMSDLDEKTILNQKDDFIKRSIKNNYKEEDALNIFNLIIKFAGYGFNKAHSVSYALISYKMMYLKTHYKERYYLELLNLNVNNSPKIKEYLNILKKENIKILKPDINKSTSTFIYDEGVRVPLSIIRNISPNTTNKINENKYKNFNDFMKKNTDLNINELKSLILSGAFDSFEHNRKTLINNLDNFISYAKLIKDIDEKYASPPEIIFYEEYNSKELLDNEVEYLGFYISSHPASKYDSVKSNELYKYFDKFITTYGILERVNKIKTKDNKTMAFLDISDEQGIASYVLFPNRINFINFINEGDLVKIDGKVEKRFDKYQIIVNKIERISDIHKE